nr:hypothetical protein [Geobacillus proteiniphilus]
MEYGHTDGGERQNHGRGYSSCGERGKTKDSSKNIRGCPVSAKVCPRAERVFRGNHSKRKERKNIEKRY